MAHDLAAADALLPHMTVNLLIADRAFDADSRVLEQLAATGKFAVIPLDLTPRDFDRELYKERYLIENFFCKLKKFRAIATRYDKPPGISLPLSTSPPLLFGSIDDRP